MQIHTVQPGETVFSIAEEYGVSPTQVLQDNEVPADGALAVGQALIIRFPRTVHAVSAGDTLDRIARTYGVTLRQIWQNNWFLGGGTLLHPGEILVLSSFDERLGTAVVNGYAYPFIEESLLAAESPFLTFLSPFTWGISAAGTLLLPPGGTALVRTGLAHGARPVLHLSTYTEEDRFDSERAVLVLTDFTIQQQLLQEIRTTVQEQDCAGVDVDFEYLPASLAGAYAAFLSRLRQLLRPDGRFVWAALAPKTSPVQPGLLYEGHDYGKVGAAVDAVLLMTYEWGYTYGPARYK